MNQLKLAADERKQVREISCRVIVLAILLTLLLAMSNAYLALKLGILTSASIPAAIISMAMLRLFKNSTILENNAVQTAASAGEAVAGGIVYTIPALIIIHYWHHFDYFTNFFIAAAGGILGVLFSIPLRRLLVNDSSLRFPEGQAIAEVLKSSRESAGIKEIVWGSVIGGLLELLQTGFKIIASSANYWLIVKKTIIGFGIGFSAAMIGAGYMIGYEMAFSILTGALISWFVAVPISSWFYPEYLADPAHQAVLVLWNNQLRYLGIGAMLFAGIWTFIKLIKPLVQNIKLSLAVFAVSSSSEQNSRTDRDIAMPFILAGVGIMAALLFLFFQFKFPLYQVGLEGIYSPTLVFGAVLYVLLIGFLFSVITAYFSGMVGVTASPGSSVVIAGMLLVAWLLLIITNHILPLPLNAEQIKAAEAITIIIGSVVTGIAAIANDNTQDLKVGQLVGATPWKQQMMLLLGVVVAALIIPPVMQLLFDVYGIAGVMPHPGMDLSQSLPAPTAALMAAITEAVFQGNLPWLMMLIGALIILAVIIVTQILHSKRCCNFSILGIAIGMYLPLSSSFPLFIGGLIAMVAHRRLRNKLAIVEEKNSSQQKGILIACGLIAGSALMDVLLAIPFSILHSPDALNLVSSNWSVGSIALALMTTLCLAVWIIKQVSR